MKYLEMTFDLLIMLFNEIFVQIVCYSLEQCTCTQRHFIELQKIEMSFRSCVRGHLLFDWQFDAISYIHQATASCIKVNGRPDLI